MTGHREPALQAARRRARDRAVAALRRTPGPLGALDAAIAYGLNWTELVQARDAVEALAKAARAALEECEGTAAYAPLQAALAAFEPAR